MIETGKVIDFKGRHRNSVSANNLSMAKNPENISFMTAKEHKDLHSKIGTFITNQQLHNREAILAQHGLLTPAMAHTPTSFSTTIGQAAIGVIGFAETMMTWSSPNPFDATRLNDLGKASMGLYEQILEALSCWNHLGVERTDDGCVFIGRMPELGQYAYFHKLLPPLSSSEIADLEAQTHIPLPPALRDFYLRSNGANFYGRGFSAGNTRLLTFTFNVYGLRKAYRQGDPGVLLRQPYDLVLENSVDAFAHENNLLHITKYGVDGSRIYICPKGSVIRILPDGARANEWPDLTDWILSELNRLSKLFDQNGKLLVATELTTPPWPVE